MSHLIQKVTLANVAEKPAYDWSGFHRELVDVVGGFYVIEGAWPAEEVGIGEVALIRRVDQHGVNVLGSFSLVDLNAGEPAQRGYGVA